MENIGKMNLINKALEYGVEVPEESDQIEYHAHLNSEYILFELNGKYYDIRWQHIDKYCHLTVRYSFYRCGKEFDVREQFCNDGYYRKEVFIHTLEDICQDDDIRKFSFSSISGFREMEE